MRQDRFVKPFAFVIGVGLLWLAFSLGRVYEKTASQRGVENITLANATTVEVSDDDLSPPDEAMAAPGRLRIITTPHCIDMPFENILSSWNCHVEASNTPQIWRLLNNQLYNTHAKRCFSAHQDSLTLGLDECHTPLSEVSFRRHGRRSPLMQVAFPAKTKGEQQLCLTPVVNNVSTDTAPIQFGYQLEPCATEGTALCKQLVLNNALALDRDKQRLRTGFNHSYTPWQLPALPSRTPTATKSVRILCWVMAHPDKLNTRARGINNTWGQQCDSLLFATTSDTSSHGLAWLPLVIPEEPDRRSYLWFKSQQAWAKLYSTVLADFDYFIRADDDTYMHMHNLRAFLSQRDPADPEYFGRLYNAQGDLYYSGGSGTVLSRGALELLGRASVAKQPDIFSPHPTFADDLELGVSMLKLGVVARPWLDEQGRHMFLGTGLEEERQMKRSVDDGHWLFVYDKHFKEGTECCSTRWLATHYVDWEAMFYYHDLTELGCEAAGLPVWWVAADGR